MDIQMRKLLVTISNMMRPEDLKTMKFFCKDVIPTKAREEIETGVDLFEKLEERGKLKPEDMSFLEMLLENTCAGRTDLIEVLHNYRQPDQSNFRSNTHYVKTCFPTESEDLSSAFSFLTKNLGKDYRMVLRRLGVPDATLEQIIDENPRNVQEVIHKALKYWSQSNAESATRASIVRALQAEKRNDLALRIAKGDI